MKKLFLTFLFVSQFSFAITSNSVWRIPSAGSLPSWGPVNLADGTNAITGALASKNNLPSVGQQVSSSCGSYNISSTLSDITNLSVTITTVGRPVMIVMQPDGTISSFGNGAQWQKGGSSNSSGDAIDIVFKRGSTGIAQFSVMGVAIAANWLASWASTLVYVDRPSAGTYTYKAQAQGSAGVTSTMQNYILMAYEL
jgi:hypothetical protein